MPSTLSSPTPTTIAAQLDIAERLCNQRGRRLTPIRRMVLEILLQRQRSVKAYELLNEIRKVQPGAAPPTVYRALDFLIAEGLIHRLDAVNAWSACMDAAGERHDILVICTQCGAVAEFSDPKLHRQLAQKVASAGYVLNHHETELRALCGPCHQKQTGTGKAQQCTHQHPHG